MIYPQLLLFYFLPMLSVQHFGCGQRYLHNPPTLTVVEPTKQDIRLLVHNTPHPMKIFGHFPTTTSTNINIKTLQTLFGVAARFYSRVISVTEMDFSSTQYPLSAGNCGISVPDNYVKDGFDQSLIDMVVFIVIEHNSQETYVAAASPCIQTRRPIYGFITFNAAHIDQADKKEQNNKASIFHQNIYITVPGKFIQVHQLTHILGFNQQFYGHFYANPRGDTRLGISRVLKNVGLRKMIITRYVLEYVRDYFDCQDEDEVVGALLEDQGGAGTSNNHWERKVYMDQLMTASEWSPGLRISRLTLSLLKDTNFYYDVDLDMAENFTWGRNRTCEFARGEMNNLPEYCQPETKGCDYYNKYMGYCSNSEPFSSGSYIIQPYNTMMCGNFEQQKIWGLSGSRNGQLIYGAGSRCFKAGNVTNPEQSLTSCYPAYCSSDRKQIYVLAGGKNITCLVPNTQMFVVGDVSFFCPRDFAVFCNVLSCPNWCNFRGLCLKGKCICNPPYFEESCLGQCPPSMYYDPDRDACMEKCPNLKYVGPESVCLDICPNGFVPDGNRICVICDSVCQHLKWAAAAGVFITTILILL